MAKEQSLFDFEDSAVALKRCSCCKSHKPLAEFGKCKSYKDGLAYRCKDCANAAQRKNRSTQEGRAKANAASLHHHKNNANGNYARRANDSLFRFQDRVKSLIGKSISKTGNKKSSRTEAILCCSISEFHKYIKNQFTGEMSFENHGSIWHIDHMIPISWARTEAEAIALNHFSNLRPLDAAENRAKGNRLSACGITQQEWYELNPMPLKPLTVKTEKTI